MPTLIKLYISKFTDSKYLFKKKLPEKTGNFNADVKLNLFNIQ